MTPTRNEFTKSADPTIDDLYGALESVTFRLRQWVEYLGDNEDDMDSIEYAETLLNRRLGSMQWQPIETYQPPKDTSGSRDERSVIIVAQYPIDPVVGEAYYEPHESGDGGEWWWANTNRGDYHADAIAYPVSNWMPLPVAPHKSLRPFAHEFGQGSVAGYDFGDEPVRGNPNPPCVCGHTKRQHHAMTLWCVTCGSDKCGSFTEAKA